jgi:Holliday junction DNA helicase RuvB
MNQSHNEEDLIDQTIRPKKLSDFTGQSNLKSNLHVFIEAAKIREKALDHVVFYGPPGLGKTTLSQIIAAELGVNIKSTSGPVITKAGDLAAILSNLKAFDVLFIDEIHRLHTAVEEILYSAMEDFTIDIVIGEGPTARSVKINLPPFTLIGATTRLGLLSNPLKDRFGIPLKLDFYKVDELKAIIIRGAKMQEFGVTEDAAEKLSVCARGTPRIALRLLRRTIDFAIHAKKEVIDLDVAVDALARLGIDSYGLDKVDQHYLTYIAANYNGGPVGIETIAAGLSEDRGSLEDMVEPYLMQIGFLARTPKGRQLTSNALEYLNLSDMIKNSQKNQTTLL